MRRVAFTATRFATIVVATIVAQMIVAEMIPMPSIGTSEVHAQSERAQARADVNAEARVFFEEGNRHFDAAREAQGPKRRGALERALQAYVSSLRIVRSRNALFNAGLVLEELGRLESAYSYYSEYLMIPGLSSREREDGAKRKNALAAKVAVVRVTSQPEGAQVFVDRLDLAPRGRTPLEIALPPGEHRLFLRLDHHKDGEANITAVTGEAVDVEAALAPEKVQIRFDVPSDGTLTIDGQSAQTEAPILLAPGTHQARFSPEQGASFERSFTVEPGTPGTVRLRATSSQASRHAQRDETTLRDKKTKTLDPWPLISLIATGAVAATATGLSIRALRLRRDFEDNPTAAAADDTEDANFFADVFWGMSAAFATTTLVLYLINRKRKRRAASLRSVAFGAQPGGVMMTAQFRWNQFRWNQFRWDQSRWNR